jgi:crotonobetainyl-CoA:carnitine CoA-transferase CaiB-like acyl-CoA transferase
MKNPASAGFFFAWILTGLTACTALAGAALCCEEAGKGKGILSR